MSGFTRAVAQEIQAQDQVQPDMQMNFLMRGTTGSGEQEPVFPEELADERQGSAQDIIRRDTSDPERQLQGRAMPAQRASAVVDPLVTATPSARSNLRMQPEQSGTGASPESDPFAATGFRIGSWRAYTSLEQTLGYSTNINGVAMGKGGAFSQTGVDLSLQSDWSRHSARIDARGIYRKPFTSDAEDIPTVNINGELSLDLADGVNADFGANYGYTTESVTSSTITSAASERPGVHTYGGFAALRRSGNRLEYSLRGSVGRTVYDDISLVSGGTEFPGRPKQYALLS